MRILVIGSGGREHALLWKLKNSPKKPVLFCIPGNAGIQSLAECPQVDLKASDGFRGILDWVHAQDIDLTIVGPEAPLAAGIVDVFRARFGVGPKAVQRLFGPTA